MLINTHISKIIVDLHHSSETASILSEKTENIRIRHGGNYHHLQKKYFR